MKLLKIPKKFERTQEIRLKAKKRWDKWKTISKMVELNPTISMIT